MKHIANAMYVAFIFIAAACSQRDAVDEKLLTTYTDYVILRMTPGDSAVVQFRLDSLLKSKGYTAESFFNDLAVYGKNPELMRVFYDSARTRIGRMQAEISR